ncbi:hypothetical protein ACCD08_30525, partial [Telluria sp. Tellsp104]
GPPRALVTAMSDAINQSSPHDASSGLKSPTAKIKPAAGLAAGGGFFTAPDQTIRSGKSRWRR